MLKRIKNILGIEGVKVSIDIPKEVSAKSGQLKGSIILTSLSDQVINHCTIVLKEKYSRGSGESRLINEYILGRGIDDESFTIAKDETVRKEFELSFVSAQSAMDRLEQSNVLYKLVARTAKYFKKVSSSYVIEAVISVDGTKLDAIAQKSIRLT